jgi:hypothetical protein
MRELEEITAELHTLSERLADARLDILSRAVDTPEEPERVALASLEKRVAKAHRALEKAINDLGHDLGD